MFERFTGETRRVLALSNEAAKRLRAEAIGEEHILAGVVLLSPVPVVIERERGAILEALRLQSLDPDAILATGSLPLDVASQRLLNLATNEADRLGHTRIHPEHLLLALLKQVDSETGELLRVVGLQSADISTSLSKEMMTRSRSRPIVRRVIRHITTRSGEG